jgi:hypothetical protein
MRSVMAALPCCGASSSFDSGPSTSSFSSFLSALLASSDTLRKAMNIFRPKLFISLASF